ncbi:MAG: PrsW family intramembrane metalloprotease [Armatimonadota bacterium]|nr:PrsW family intramembrane metalloprotease [Armatimonadota bacterium]MDR7451391.1 PrsW family intramembrane metalloprotease [Armatimonadota bacterium]MDR7466459.1 PrsW family intramembrane metalloprotease [Armatimonadota bacterium]MDR7493181.1 PrsW family intramembrane metalloprotease [Armatimonadota bacterium]MDR7499466.1 PrsW family intramembrane metalloprotease [Armatimonadota bacterium]
MDIRIMALLAALVPALLWLWFFYSRDRYEREPKSLIGKLFLWGLLSGFWAAGLNDFLSALFGPQVNAAAEGGAITLAVTLLAAMVVLAALNEETMKYLVTTNSTRNDPRFNEVVDGMIYLTTAALGFAAGENFGYIMRAFVGTFQSATEAGASGGQAGASALVAALAVTAPLRALLSSLGHVSWSGITGYVLGRRIVGGGSARSVVFGLLAASGLHAAYNLPQFLDPDEALLTPYFGLAVAVWALGVGIYFLLLRKALRASPFRRDQLARRPLAAAEAEPGG